MSRHIFFFSDSQIDKGNLISDDASGSGISQNRTVWRMSYEFAQLGIFNVNYEIQELGGHGFGYGGSTFDDTDIGVAIDSGANILVICSGSNETQATAIVQATYQAAIRGAIEKFMFGTDKKQRTTFDYIIKMGPPPRDVCNTASVNFAQTRLDNFEKVAAEDALLESWWNSTYPEYANKLRYIDTFAQFGSDHALASNFPNIYSDDGTHWAVDWQVEAAVALVNNTKDIFLGSTTAGHRRAKVGRLGRNNFL